MTWGSVLSIYVCTTAHWNVILRTLMYTCHKYFVKRIRTGLCSGIGIYYLWREQTSHVVTLQERRQILIFWCSQQEHIIQYPKSLILGSASINDFKIVFVRSYWEWPAYCVYGSIVATQAIYMYNTWINSPIALYTKSAQTTCI